MNKKSLYIEFYNSEDLFLEHLYLDNPLLEVKGDKYYRLL